MSSSQLLAAGRSAFLQVANDTLQITAPGDGDPEFDEETGTYSDPPRVVVYRGPGRIQVKADINSNVVETTAGEREWTYLTAQLQLPTETPSNAVGDVYAVRTDYVCEVLDSPDSPALVGALFNIQGTYNKSQAVYLRFRVREVIA